MIVGLSDTLYRQSIQTALLMLCLKDMVLSEQGKGVGQKHQVSVKKLNKLESLLTGRKDTSLSKSSPFLWGEIIVTESC
jgi:hypothetical protein